MLSNHPRQKMTKKKMEETLNRLHLNQVRMETAVAAARLIRQRKSPSQSEVSPKVDPGERSTLISTLTSCTLNRRIKLRKKLPLLQTNWMKQQLREKMTRDSKNGGNSRKRRSSWTGS